MIKNLEYFNNCKKEGLGHGKETQDIYHYYYF